MRINRRQLSVITKAPPAPKPDPLAPLAAKLEALEARLPVAIPPAPQPYDDRALMARIEAMERAITAMSASKFTFDIFRNAQGQIQKIEVTRPGLAPGTVWRM
jgi:hypothetical protein